MIEPNSLIDDMNRLGVHFLVGEGYPGFAEPLQPTILLAELAAQSDARMHLALIALLLQHPEIAKAAPEALELMDDPHKLTFKVYYTAVHYLQIAYANQLLDVLGPSNKLPDLFPEELNIKRDNAVIDPLKQLAEHHKEITGLPLNWIGTYHHAAQRVISHLKKERVWATV